VKNFCVFAWATPTHPLSIPQGTPDIQGIERTPLPGAGVPAWGVTGLPTGPQSGLVGHRWLGVSDNRC